ncbi:MBL fold metallo-hydrolase [uncultured Thiocystis sp.]|uniref:MBL fold metallo-hydrolase n=1 Tax=uncultured Thiocystis sp. TaxID=1202134 RepID=UPI0025E741B3|nr:MBL fold metallo-hydrolase [uncultured Thiocystis sp.]
MTDLNRRKALKFFGLALGGLASLASNIQNVFASAEVVTEVPPPSPPPAPPSYDWADANSLLYSLETYIPGSETLAHDEMRISFIGTSPILRRAQADSSVFVELGNGDCFMFDCGTGVTINYAAMKIPMSKLRKIFLTHLHGDHTGDLTQIYCFGPQQDGKSPLYIWGPSASGVEDPKVSGKYYDDGTLNFCRCFRELNRWHSESQSFVPTKWTDAPGDGYDIIATELNWRTGEKQTWNTNDPYPNPDLLPTPSKFSNGNITYPDGGGIAYEENGVRISFFPAVHDRNGSISYKLEWLTQGLSMIFSGDTKPNNFMVSQATNSEKPVDIFIHEMVVPPETWVSKNGGDANPLSFGLKTSRSIEENSHTPEMALGYMLYEMNNRGKAPRLAVATHFQAEDDTMVPAFDSLRSWYHGAVTIAADFMVFNVTKTQIHQRRAAISDYTWIPPIAKRVSTKTDTPKYSDTRDSNPYYPMGPLNQFDQSLLDNVINPCDYDPLDFGCVYPYSPPPKS